MPPAPPCSAGKPCICARGLLTQLTQKGLLPMEAVSKALWLIILSQGDERRVNKQQHIN